ncbi:hypothetical protein [Dolichospermum circinale]|uniref:hypothetical protein n=1 Tax=Dolichospermum circinale TaxID=109265 RepID=UPI0023301234|nr:hypothetical protein [Dolichospermum circinale]MDB9473251.1 hypothetical protein [Dolichospermum circinale CS-537/11]MDB9480732.1 hypothetical protein [Dolichospermum circinale CS-537/03]MDB9483756.1 hypothetical protein [Dolichospermum circinale CS-537/05]
MKKLHKLLMTTTVIVSIFGWNIYSTQAQIPTNMENFRKGQTHPLVCDWVQNTTRATNRVVFQSNGTLNIVYGLGNMDIYKWAAPNSSSGTVQLTNGYKMIDFSPRNSLPNRSESYALNQNRILSFLGREYRCKS